MLLVLLMMGGFGDVGVIIVDVVEAGLVLVAAAIPAMVDHVVAVVLTLFQRLDTEFAVRDI